ncbi:MAG: SMC-Scp complex subunit ScpB [Coriobacteriia bacterium]|nr:SMC-Scp complex subunit ScpB [Coriobacteriia bacterium]
MSNRTDELRGPLEALLFVSDEPVTAARLAKIVESTPAGVEKALHGLSKEYAEQERGFQLREVAGGWRMYTHPAHHPYVEQFVLSWDTRRLSQAALEALAVIAYHQPVTRTGVNAVRGVNSEAVIASLVEKRLVHEAGRDKNPGNAILYGTTRAFLEKFGLRDLSELPPLNEFAPDPDTERAIRERLNALDGPTFEDEDVEDVEEDDEDEDVYDDVE